MGKKMETKNTQLPYWDIKNGLANKRDGTGINKKY